MELGESKEDYLEAIYALTEGKQEVVRSIRIAEYMQVSRASASIALRKLEKLGYLQYCDTHGVRLTEKGHILGGKIYDRHLFFTEFLQTIGVSPGTASKDACRLEHVVSDESYDKFKCFLKAIQAD